MRPEHPRLASAQASHSIAESIIDCTSLARFEVVIFIETRSVSEEKPSSQLALANASGYDFLGKNTLVQLQNLRVGLQESFCGAGHTSVWLWPTAALYNATDYNIWDPLPENAIANAPSTSH